MSKLKLIVDDSSALEELLPQKRKSEDMAGTSNLVKDQADTLRADSVPLQIPDAVVVSEGSEECDGSQKDPMIMEGSLGVNPDQLPEKDKRCYMKVFDKQFFDIVKMEEG